MSAAVVAVVIAIGFAFRVVGVPRSRTTSDLFAAIQPPGVVLLASGAAAEHLGGAGLVAVLAAGRVGGPDGAWLAAALTGGLVAFAAVVAGPARRGGLGTPGDLARVRWGDDRTAARLHLATLVVAVGLLVPVFQASSLVVARLMPLGDRSALVVVASVVLAAVLLFGGRGSLYAQHVRLLALVAAVIAAGALGAAGVEVPLIDRVVPADAAPDDGRAAIQTVTIVIGTIAVPQLWPRVQASGSVVSARRAAVAAAVVVAIVGLAATVVGGTPGGAGPADGLTDDLGIGVFLGGVASGCLAAASPLVLAAGAAAHRLGLAHGRTAPAVVVVIAGLLAAATSDAGPLLTLGWAYGVGAVALAPALVAGLWLRSASAVGVRAGVVTGLVLAGIVLGAAWSGAVAGGGGPVPLGLEVLVAAAVSATVTVVASRRRPDHSVRGHLRLHRPNRPTTSFSSPSP